MNEMVINELKSKAEVSLVEIYPSATAETHFHHDALKLKEGLEMAQEIHQDLKKALNNIVP